MYVFLTFSSCKDSGQVGLGSCSVAFSSPLQSLTEGWQCRAPTERAGVGAALIPTPDAGFSFYSSVVARIAHLPPAMYCKCLMTSLGV